MHNIGRFTPVRGWPAIQNGTALLLNWHERYFTTLWVCVVCQWPCWPHMMHLWGGGGTVLYSNCHRNISVMKLIGQNGHEFLGWKLLGPVTLSVCTELHEGTIFTIFAFQHCDDVQIKNWNFCGLPQDFGECLHDTDYSIQHDELHNQS